MVGEQPKRPAGGGYGQYLAEKREAIKAALPKDHKIMDVTKKAGELWRALTEAEKEKYIALFKKAREEYRDLLVKFTAAGGVVVRKSSSKRTDDKLTKLSLIHI